MPRGAGRLRVIAASSLLCVSSAALSEPDPTVVGKMITFCAGNSGSAASSNCCNESFMTALPGDSNDNVTM